MSGTHTADLMEWLRATLGSYVLEPVAIYRPGVSQTYPITAASEEELQDKLAAGGHFIPLPKEPASLANVLEVAIIDFLMRTISDAPGIVGTKGSERGYPDLEISGDRFGGGFHAIDVKVARRARNARQTESRITLYTGNTYFLHPSLEFPGILRPFNEYSSHLDIVALYTLNSESYGRIDDLRLIVQEPWRIASRQRSSTTREYIGAVQKIEDIANGSGEFKTEAEFYSFWRKYPFKTGRIITQQLRKVAAAKSMAEPKTSRTKKPKNSE